MTSLMFALCLALCAGGLADARESVFADPGAGSARQLLGSCGSEAGVDLFASRDLDALSAGSADECCSLCQANADCGAWTWVSKDWTLNCYLKRSTGWTRKSCSYCTSGLSDGTTTSTAPATSSAPAAAACTEAPGVDYYADSDLAELSVSSSGECCAACQADLACKGWTFLQNNWDLNCYLKDTWTEQTCSDCTSGTSNGGVSAPVETPAGALPPPDTCTEEVGIDLYAARDLAELSATSAGGCCALCQSNPACSAWTFVDKDWSLNCYLKGNSGWQRKPCDDCTSGLVDRRTVQSSGDLGTCSPRNGIDLFSNNDLTAVWTASPDDCCEHCQQNPICWAWSYVTKDWDTNCYTKGPAGWTEQSTDYCISGTVSRTASLQEVAGADGVTQYRPLSKGCAGEEGTLFSGGDLAGGVEYTGSAQECCRRCSTRSACFAWTYFDSGFCYLKGGTGWARESCPSEELCISGEVDRNDAVDRSLPIAFIDGAIYGAELVSSQSVDSDFAVDSDSAVELTVDELKDVLGGMHRAVTVFCDALKDPCAVTARGFLVAISGGTGLVFDALAQGVCVLEGMARVENAMDTFCDQSANAGEAALDGIVSNGLWAAVTTVTLRKLYSSSCRQFPAGERMSSLAKGLGLEEAMAGRRLQGFWSDITPDFIENKFNAAVDTAKDVYDKAADLGSKAKDAFKESEVGQALAAGAEEVKEVGGKIIDKIEKSEVGRAVVGGVKYVYNGVKDHVLNYFSTAWQCAEQVGDALG